MKTKEERMFEKAKDVAMTYGFESLVDLNEKMKGKRKSKIRQAKILKDRHGIKRDIQSILKMYLEHKSSFDDSPILIYHSSVDKTTRHLVNKSKSAIPSEFTISIIGLDSSAAEGICISAANRILKEIGNKDTKICINSVGDKTSSKKYLRQLMKCLNQKKNTLDEKCLNSMKKSQFDTHKLVHGDESYTELRRHLPMTLDCLTDDSSNHFQEVIEFLDAQRLDYTLSQEVIDDTEIFSHTIFEIKDQKGGTIAFGGRMDSMADNMFFEEIPIVSCSIKISDEKTIGDYVPKKRRLKRPKVFFLHCGYNARKLSLPILEICREEKIPIAHSLPNEKVCDQIQNGGGREFEYMLILGNKESLSDTVILRNQSTRNQQVLSIKEMVTTLRKISNS